MEPTPLAHMEPAQTIPATCQHTQACRWRASCAATQVVVQTAGTGTAVAAGLAGVSIRPFSTTPVDKPARPGLSLVQRTPGPLLAGVFARRTLTSANETVQKAMISIRTPMGSRCLEVSYSCVNRPINSLDKTIALAIRRLT